MMARASASGIVPSNGRIARITDSCSFRLKAEDIGTSAKPLRSFRNLLHDVGEFRDDERRHCQPHRVF